VFEGQPLSQQQKAEDYYW
jgi:hypothetical protein